jgi:S1-C subfamily serine protease
LRRNSIPTSFNVARACLLEKFDMTSATDTPKKKTPSLGILDGEFTPEGYLRVTKLDRFGSLAKAGSSAGDIVKEIDGTIPHTRDQLQALVAATTVGQTVPILIQRGSKTFRVPVKMRSLKQLSISLNDVGGALERKIAP